MPVAVRDLGSGEENSRSHDTPTLDVPDDFPRSGVFTVADGFRASYLASDGKASIRVRIRGDSTATLTIKSRPVDLRRLELEYDIPVLEAEALMQLRQGSVIEKVDVTVKVADTLGLCMHCAAQ